MKVYDVEFDLPKGTNLPYRLRCGVPLFVAEVARVLAQYDECEVTMTWADHVPPYRHEYAGDILGTLRSAHDQLRQGFYRREDCGPSFLSTYGAKAKWLSEK